MKKILLLLIAGLMARFLWAGPADDGYAAHEWGTFTSVQAGQGSQLVWNPLLTTDLPKFVYDRNRVQAGPAPANVPGSKGERPTLQRMETPVIYFYSGKNLTVDVAVDFPDGLVTEWYPQATQFGPLMKTGGAGTNINRSFVQWRNVEVLRAGRQVAALPNDGSPSHYFAARETDADFIRVAGSAGAQHDKFLFYRGVGYFPSPLIVSVEADGNRLSLRNTFSESLRHLMVLSIGDGAGTVSTLDALERNAVRGIAIQGAPMPLEQLKKQVGERMAAALVAEGLFEREAQAMVKTWRDSWFDEKGVRVLYILPRSWTDGVLPLKLDPAPKELVRVMVGRVELITPSMESGLSKQIVSYSKGDERAKAQAVRELRTLGLGRFSEAAARRVLGASPDPRLERDTSALLQAVAALDKVAQATSGGR